MTEDPEQPSTGPAADRRSKPDANVASGVNVGGQAGASKRVSSRQRVVQRDGRTVVTEERTASTTVGEEGGRGGERDTDELSLEELENEEGSELPDREAMSLLDASVAIPVNPAVAADVLSEGVDAEPEPGPEHAAGPASRAATSVTPSESRASKAGPAPSLSRPSSRCSLPM